MKHWPTLRASMWLYLISALGLIAAPSALMALGLLKSESTFLWTAVLEILVIGLPALCYALKKGGGAWLRLNPVSVKTTLLTAITGLVGVFALMMLTMLFALVLEALGASLPESAVPMPKNSRELQIAILALAVAPALCEELLFRGIMLPAMEGFGTKRAIIASGVLFGLLHMSLSSLPVVVILGCVMGYLCIKTRSIWTACVYHFVHNATSVFVSYFAGDGGGGANEAGIFESLGAEGVIAAICMGAALMVAYIFLLRLVLRAQGVDLSSQERPLQPHMGALAWVPLCVTLSIILLALAFDAANMWNAVLPWM